MHSKRFWPYLMLVFCIALIVTGSFLLFNHFNKPRINVLLVGDEYINISIFKEFTDPGFVVEENAKIIPLDTINYKENNTVDTSTLGTYTVSYLVNYKNHNYELKRTVAVTDEIPPVITTSKNEVELYRCAADDMSSLDYQVVDNYDGVITNKAKVTKFNDHWVIEAIDSSSNIAIKEIPITYTEDPSPIINLKGSSTVYLKKGDTYKELGAAAYNGCKQEINNQIVIENNVDNKHAGKYKVKYRVTLDNGKSSEITRTVVVYEPVNKTTPNASNGKVIYLTFDDGPGVYTERILEILKKYNVKATFFVTNQFKGYVNLIKKEVDEGHTVGVHSLTHRWSIYQSVETYMKDFNDMNDIIYSYTNKRANIFRFPGGSSNTVSKNYSTGVVSAIASKMQSYGYVYFDWNVDSGDAAGANKTQIYNNVIKGIKNHSTSVVLMHDIKKNTCEELEDIINYALANGYTFKALDASSPTMHHRINN